MGHETNAFDTALSKVIKHDEAEELLFESYRKVCLTVSRNLGPKIIGLLTAKLLLEDRVADEKEERIFMLAEEMTDQELIDFCVFYDKLQEQIVGTFEYLLLEEQRDSNWKSVKTSISTPSLTSALGLWAGKLERRGFLYPNTCVEEIDYKEDSERHIDEDGTLTKYSHYAVVEEDVIELYEVIRRAQGPKC